MNARLPGRTAMPGHFALRWVVALGGVWLALGARAANAPDADFLEFLGSVDSEEQGWHDYLGSTDVNQVVGKPAPPAQKEPPTRGQTPQGRTQKVQT